ncbi:MAG: DMT family transporter [Phycisphaerales bacterium]|nr:DMT family transporter [Phycisphaerales bacterium]
MNTASTRRRAMLALFAGAICISFAAIFAKKALQADMGPMGSAFWRLVLAVPLFAVVALPALRRGITWSWMLWLPAFFFGFDLLTWHLAFQYTTAGISTLIVNTSVVLVGLGGWLLLKERIGMLWAAGAALAIVGVGGIALTATPGHGASNPLLGNMLSLCTAVCYACYLLSAKVVRRTVPTSVLMLTVVIGAAVILFIGMVLTSEPLMPGTGEAWLWVALMALVPQTLGQGLVIHGLKDLPASFSAIVLLLQPVGTTIWGAMFLDEVLTATDLGLGGLVLAGILLARLGTVDSEETSAACTRAATKDTSP